MKLNMKFFLIIILFLYYNFIIQKINNIILFYFIKYTVVLNIKK